MWLLSSQSRNHFKPIPMAQDTLDGIINAPPPLGPRGGDGQAPSDGVWGGLGNLDMCWLHVHEKLTNSTCFYEKTHTISVFFHEKHTFWEKGHHFREFCENDARFPWVEFVDFPKNSLKFHKEFTKFSLKTHKFNTFSRKTHIFRKGTSFLRILRKWRTFPMGRICRFPQEFIEIPPRIH